MLMWFSLLVTDPDLDEMTAELRLCCCFLCLFFLAWWDGIFAGVFAKNGMQMVVF